MLKLVLSLTLLSIFSLSSALKCYDCSLNGRIGTLGRCTRTRDCPGLCQTTKVNGGENMLIELGCATQNQFPPPIWGSQQQANFDERQRQRPSYEPTTEQTELDKSNQRLAEQQRYSNNYPGQPAVPGTYFIPQPQLQPFPGQLFPGQQPFPGQQQYPGQPLLPSPGQGQLRPGQESSDDRRDNQQDPNREFSDRERQFGARQFPNIPPPSSGQYPGQQYPGQQYPGQQYPGQQYPGQQNPGQNQPFPGQQFPNTIPPTMGTCDTSSAIQRFRNLFPGERSTSAACTTCHTELCNEFNGGSLVTGRVHYAIIVSLGAIFAMKKVLN